MHHRIVKADDLAVHFDRVGHQDGVFIDPQHALRQAGFAVAGRSIKEDRVLRNERRPELVEHVVGDHEVGKSGAQELAVDIDLGGLCLVACW